MPRAARQPGVRPPPSDIAPFVSFQATLQCTSPGSQSMPDTDHIIVLMLENRSFDFMLGYCRHPSADFPSLNGSFFNNLHRNGSTIKVLDSDNGSPTLPKSPDHSHRGVKRQLYGAPVPGPPKGTPKCSGFADDYEGVAPGSGHRIMRCLQKKEVKSLASLARTYGLATKWFSSVPGETWPNRNFAHAGTSDGEVNINMRLYRNRTIFEALEDAGVSWGIFREGLPQLYCFPALWRKRAHGVKGSFNDLLGRIQSGDLPAYSFVEPRHFHGKSSSQHPGNNGKDRRDFDAGEGMIAALHDALVANPDVFERTVLLITYDEHGGHFDHVPPPIGPQFKDGRIGDDQFEFDLLGVRVPAVVVSPWIDPGALDNDTIYDHASIVHTVRQNFIPNEPPLPGTRDSATGNFLSLLRRENPRTPNEVAAIASNNPRAMSAFDSFDPTAGERPATVLDEFQASLLWIARVIIAAQGSPEAAEAAAALEELVPTEAQLATMTVDDVHNETERALAILRERDEELGQGEVGVTVS